MYTFGELKNQVATMVQRKDDSDYLIKIAEWLNFSQDFAFRSYDFYEELESTHTFNTANGTESYYMPSIFDKPLRIFDTTNNAKLKITTEENYQEVNLSNILNATKGHPAWARIFGVSPVKYPVSGSGVTLKVKSSSTADTQNVVVRIEGFIDSAKTIYDFEAITISASSPTSYITATTPKTFYAITKISKSADTDGYITVADSSSNVLAVMTAIERQSRYPELRLGLIPDGTYAMRVLYKRNIHKMVNDSDYPFIDADEFFITNAVGYAMNEEKEGLDRATAMWSKAQNCLNQIIRNQQSRLGPDFQHKMISATRQAHRV